jgi:hypothetical protein
MGSFLFWYLRSDLTCLSKSSRIEGTACDASWSTVCNLFGTQSTQTIFPRSPGRCHINHFVRYDRLFHHFFWIPIKTDKSSKPCISDSSPWNTELILHDDTRIVACKIQWGVSVGQVVESLTGRLGQDSSVLCWFLDLQSVRHFCIPGQIRS